MKKLIVEVWKNSGLKQLDAKSLPAGLNTIPEGMMLVEGVVGRVDSVNRNNRFYPEGEYRKHVEEMTTRIVENNGILGEMEHPKSMNINLNNVSHKVMEVRIDENGFVLGKILLLDTPKGKIAQSIVRSGSPLPISSRGMGQTSESGAVTLEYMATYDLVGTAGFAETGLKSISESVDEEGKIVSEFYEYSVDGNGNVITEAALEAVVESVEAKLVAKYDAILGKQTPDIATIVNEQLNSKIEQIQSFVGEGELVTKKPEGVTDGEDGKELTSEMKSQFLALLNEHFLDVQIPIIENWATKHMLPKAAEVQENWIRTTFMQEMSEGIEKWMFETVLPKNAEVTENWVKTDFTKDLSEGLESWIKGDYTKSLCEGIESNLDERFDETLKVVAEGKKSEGDDCDDEGKEDKKSTTEGEDNTKAGEQGKDGNELTNEGQTSIPATILEKLDARIVEAKAKKEAKAAKDKEEKESEEAKRAAEDAKKLDESLAGEKFYVRNMPQRFKHIWECLSADQRSTVHRKASIRTMVTNEHIEEFWTSLNLTNDTLALKEGKKAYTRNVNESLRPEAGSNFRKGLAQLSDSMS